MAKVLLVEDDNNLREIYQARLTAEGYDIVAAQNGEEALVVAKQNKPDLIISDVMMPRISGFEMLDILRNTDSLKHTKVIMLTALGQSEDQKRATNLGADKYLVKSQVTLEDIVNAAKELLGADSMDNITAVPTAPAPSVTTQAAPMALAVEPTSEEPAPAATPIIAPAPSPAVVSAPAPEPAAVPASVVPQPDTTVVVPPAPANPTPPAVTVAPIAPAPAAEPTTAPAEPVITPATLPEPPAPDPQPTAPVTETVEPAEAPTEAPVPEPTPVVESAAAAVTDAASQTLEAEEAALQAQIDSYAKEPAETPAAVDPAQAAANDASNEEALADTVEELKSASTTPEPIEPPSVVNANVLAAAEPAPEPAPAASAPASAPVVPDAGATTFQSAQKPAPAAPTDNVNVAGKKVISPINDPTTKPDLDVLLAKEEAKTPAAPAAPVVNGAQGAPPTQPPTAPGQAYDPNTVAL